MRWLVRDQGRLRLRSWLAQHKIHLLLFAAGLIVFASVAGTRLRKQSSDPHFVYLADAWLHGQIAIDPPPTKGDDWAKVTRVQLESGEVVRGRWLASRGFTAADPWIRRQIDAPDPKAPGGIRSIRFFRTTDGRDLPETAVAETLSTAHHVSFPPFPAVLLLPQAAVHGRIANDVALTVLVAALVLPLGFAALRRLAEARLSERTVREDLWLVACLGFGTVFFFSAVQGRVWFTAHVVGVALAAAYAYCCIEARHPIAAGILLGLAALTRAPMAFMFPLFAFEAWRISGGRKDLAQVARLCARFAAPVIAIAAAAMVYNAIRFGAPTEFGHSYLDVRQQALIEEHGLFSYRYLSRNLAVALALLPRPLDHWPYFQISEHGLALWFTTPVFLLLLWPRERGPMHRALVVTTLCVAIPILFYQNSGRVQFGYRFSLDYTVFLVLLLAVGGRPLSRWAKLAIAAGIAVNLVGAITFARMPAFYDLSSYDVVVPH